MFYNSDVTFPTSFHMNKQKHCSAVIFIFCCTIPTYNICNRSTLNAFSQYLRLSHLKSRSSYYTDKTTCGHRAEKSKHLISVNARFTRAIY